MTDETKTGAIPSLEDWQHWTWVMGRAQQMLLEAWADSLKTGAMPGLAGPSAFDFGMPGFGAGAPADPMAMMAAGAEAWAKGLEGWGRMMGLDTSAKAEAKDRRFSASEWKDNPLFDQIRRTYLAISDRMLGTVEQIEGLDDEARRKLRFATRNFVDAMSPSNFALTNPQVLRKSIETRGENLLSGLGNML